MPNKSANFVVMKMVNPSDRFEIVDLATGEVLDNAQGYGYKTYANAMRVGWYKFSGGKEKIHDVATWWKRPENLQFKEYLEEMMFYAAKDCGGDESRFRGIIKTVAEQYAKENKIKGYDPKFLKHLFRKR